MLSIRVKAPPSLVPNEKFWEETGEEENANRGYDDENKRDSIDGSTDLKTECSSKIVTLAPRPRRKPVLVRRGSSKRRNSGVHHTGEYDDDTGGVEEEVDESTPRKEDSKSRLVRRSSSKRRNSGVHDKPPGFRKKGDVLPKALRVKLSDEMYTSFGPVRTDSIDLDTMTGFLLKRSKHIHRFQKRYFQLSIQKGLLNYYMNEVNDVSATPRGSFKITDKSVVSLDPSDDLIVRISVFETVQGTPTKKKKESGRLSTLFLKASSRDDTERWLSAFRSSTNYRRLVTVGKSETSRLSNEESDDEACNPESTLPNISNAVDGDATGVEDDGTDSSSALAASKTKSPFKGLFSRLTGPGEIEKERDDLKVQLESCLQHLRRLSDDSDRLAREKGALEESKRMIETQMKRMEESLRLELSEKDAEIRQLKTHVEDEKKANAANDEAIRRELTTIHARVETLEGGGCKGCAVQ
eukprot:g4314.t1